MNFKEHFTKELVSCGMWQDEAVKVIEAAVVDKTMKDFDGRWRDAPEDYPPIVTEIMWMSIKRIALAWIDANKPMAWYRQMFVK